MDIKDILGIIITKGKLPTASITTKRGIKVFTKESIQLCGVIFFILSHGAKWGRM